MLLVLEFFYLGEENPNLKTNPTAHVVHFTLPHEACIEYGNEGRSYSHLAILHAK